MSKAIVITGANRGIGLELVKKFHKEGDAVFALCRKSSTDLEKVAKQVITSFDVTDHSSHRKILDKLETQTIDILINNAGILQSDDLESVSDQNVLKQFQVNALGPLFLTRTLLPKLQSSSKVAMITSRMGSVEDNTSGGQYGYRMSKAALNMAGRSLAQDLKPKGIAVGLLHPGYVKTDMTNHTGHISPEEAAKGLYERIQELNLENTGQFWHSNGEQLPW